MKTLFPVALIASVVLQCSPVIAGVTDGELPSRVIQYNTAYVGASKISLPVKQFNDDVVSNEQSMPRVWSMNNDGVMNNEQSMPRVWSMNNDGVMNNEQSMPRVWSMNN